MDIQYDNDNSILQFKSLEYLGFVFKYAIQKNGDGDIVFSCAGISSLIEQYADLINPIRYKGTYSNPNDQFNPVMAFIDLFPKLDSKHKFLFVKSIIEHTNFLRIDDVRLSNCLSALGYSLIGSDDSHSQYSISQTCRGVIQREEDIILLEQKIKQDYPDLYGVYDEMISTFCNGAYKSCVDNCRTLYEKITSNLTEGVGNDDAALTLSGELIFDSNGNPLRKRKEIYQYWLDNKKGYNRYRYFTTLYSIMSGFGTHYEEEPSKADAIMIMRALEDVLVWMLKIS